MYPTGFGPSRISKEDLELAAALAASVSETTRPDGYGASTSTEHEYPEMAAAIEASRLETERQMRASEQAQRDAMARHYHTQRVSPQTTPTTAPTPTLSEDEEIRLAELVSEFDYQQSQRQEAELARFAGLSRLYHSQQIPTIQPSAPQPYPSAQPTYYQYPSAQPTYGQPSYPSTQPTYGEPTYPSAQPTYPTTSQFQPSRLTPSVPSSVPPIPIDPLAASEEEQLRQAELLSLQEQTAAESLQEQQRQQEEEVLAAALRLSEMEKYPSLPHQMRDSSYQLRSDFQMPTRAAARLPTTIQGSSTLEQAVENAGRINRLSFKSSKIERNEIGNPYLVLTYISKHHRTIAEHELRNVYGMFQSASPEGAGTTELILNVEQTREFQTKF